MTIKLVDNSSELSLYSYSKSPEAIEAIKEESKSEGDVRKYRYSIR